MNNIKTVAIIVTYNRSELLKRCLINLKKQTQKVDKILVINNGSTDDTHEVLKDFEIDSIKQANLGSAGGWNTGLKYALDYGFDAAWLMDDDGYPDKNAYQILKNSFTKNMSCISSVVVNEYDKSQFVFPYPLFNKNGMPKIGFNMTSISLVSNLQKFCKNDLYPWTQLFNGALISIETVKKIGNVNQNYFIYGDEVDYLFRLRKEGKIFSHAKAIHYHPKIYNRPYNNVQIFYFLRNSIVNYKKYYDKKLLRSTLGIIYLLFKIYQKNKSLRKIFSLLVGKDREIFYSSISQGLRNKLGINHEIK